MFFGNIYFLIYVSVLMTTNVEPQQIIIIDSFSSVFMDNISNEIEYNSSDMESVRISSVEQKTTDNQSQIYNSLHEKIQYSKSNKNKCSFSIVRWWCECV